MGRPTIYLPVRLFTAWILAWLTMAAAAAGPLAPAADLAADAAVLRQKRLPMLVLFSRHDCPWCEKVRRLHLEPLAGDGRTQALLREVDVEAATPLVDFDGRRTSHQAFAAGRKARFTPTVMFLGPDGQALADAIVGYPSPDFYGGLIDNALDKSRARLRSDMP